MAVVIWNSFTEFPNKGKEPVETASFGQNIPMEICGPLASRGDPEYSSRKKPKQTFPFEFRQKCLESLA